MHATGMCPCRQWVDFTATLLVLAGWLWEVLKAWWEALPCSAGAPHCNKCTQHVAGAAARCTAHAHTVCCAALQTWGAAWLRTVIQAVCTDMATPTAIPTAGATQYYNLPSAAPSASVVCFLSSSINCCRCSRNVRRWSCRVAHERVAAGGWQQQHIQQ